MASGLTTYTALNVPASTSSSSPNSLHWSGDGQACFMSKNAIHIMTPDLGVHIDTSPSIKASIGKVGVPVGWFRTMIEFNKGTPRNWSVHSKDEWGAVSFGALDMTLRAFACSPSNLTRDSGCVIAVLTSNMELTLWSASKNHLNGKWTGTGNVSDFLLEHYAKDKRLSELEIILHAQVTCLAWSSQPDFGLLPAPRLDASLLVVGNRAGCLCFLRFAGETVTHVHTIKVANSWVTHVAISDWLALGDQESRAYVAFAIDNGSIGLVKVLQRLQTQTHVTDYTLGVSIEVCSPQILEAEKRRATLLAWVKPPDHGPILVHCKPGTVHFWSLSSTADSWGDFHSLSFRWQSLSPAASPLSPVSGLIFVPKKDIIILSLFDGTLHVVHNVSAHPSWSSGDGALTGDGASAVASSVFAEVEQTAVQRSGLSRITCLASYDDNGIVTWVHESCHPLDLSYKHDAAHNSTFITTELWREEKDFALGQLSRILKIGRAASGDAPIHLLRSVLLHLHRNGTLDSLHTRIMDILRPQAIDTYAELTIHAMPENQLREAFRSSLARHFFGCDTLLSLRLRFAVADFCWKLSDDPHRQTECGSLAQSLLDAISHRVLRVIYRHLGTVLGAVTQYDVSFMHRMITHSKLPGCPPDLYEDAQNMFNFLHMKMPMENSFDEPCPACRVPVPLQTSKWSQCINGHKWMRCSVTSFLLSSPASRTCLGCGRKAFLPLSRMDTKATQGLQPALRSWLVEDLLEAVTRCLVCGNNFVVIL